MIAVCVFPVTHPFCDGLSPSYFKTATAKTRSPNRILEPGMGVERRVQPLEFRDPRFVQLRRIYVPHAFLALLIDHLGHDRKSESYFRLHVVGSKPTGPATF